MENLFNFATEIEKNLKAECEAVEFYTQLLKSATTITESEEDLTAEIESIKEIIGDELNHQLKLQAIYEKITGIEAKKE